MRQCRLHWKWGHRRSIYSCTKKTLDRRSKSSGKEGWNAIVYPWGMDEVANWPVIHVINVLLYQHVDGAYMVLFCVLSYPLWQVVNNCAIPHSCSLRAHQCTAYHRSLCSEFFSPICRRWSNIRNDFPRIKISNFLGRKHREKMWEKSLRWYDHVIRFDESSLAKLGLNIEVARNNARWWFEKLSTTPRLA